MHRLNIKPFELYSVRELFAGVYTAIKSTKMKFIPIEKKKKKKTQTYYLLIHYVQEFHVKQYCKPSHLIS